MPAARVATPSVLPGPGARMRKALGMLHFPEVEALASAGQPRTQSELGLEVSFLFALLKRKRRQAKEQDRPMDNLGYKVL